MSEHIYKHVGVTGTSKNFTDETVRSAIAKAAKTIRDKRWFEINDSRGFIKKGEAEFWQITIRIGFTLAY